MYPALLILSLERENQMVACFIIFCGKENGLFTNVQYFYVWEMEIWALYMCGNSMELIYRWYSDLQSYTFSKTLMNSRTLV